MMLAHRYLAEPVMIECETSDRGRMIVDLNDEMQFPIYYNNFESKYDLILRSILPGTRIALDVGGNIGQYALLFSRYAERVFTFEPMPKKIAHLSYHIALNYLAHKIKLIPKALSDREGNAIFALPYDPANDGTASLVLDPTWDSPRITVECTSLDTFCKIESLDEIDLIKMDIEGGELAALRGMTNVLSQPHKPILILELNQPMMSVAGYTASDVQEFLRPFGYKAYDMTKKGLVGPLRHLEPWAENYCFLAPEHLHMEKVKKVLAKTRRVPFLH